YHTYGMTETLSHIALRKISGENPQAYFTPLENIKIKSKEGCLWIETPYHNSPVATKDLVQIFENETFAMEGRADFIINSGGIKINPEKVEQLIAEMNLSAKPFAISARKHSAFGEVPVLVTEEGQSDIFLPLQ